METSLILTYEIEPITNPMLPVLKGTSFIIDSYFTVHYHINLTNIRTCLNQIEQTTLLLNKTIYRVKNKELSHLVFTKIHHTLDKINNLKNTLNHCTSKPRNKRGLINIAGSAQKWLFGTLDSEDGIKYDHYIKILKDNQNILHKDLNSQKIVIDNLTQTIDSQLAVIERNQKYVSERLKSLDLKIQTTFAILYISFLNDNINLELSQIETTFRNIQTAINFAKTGTMHYSILKYDDLEKILGEVSSNKQIPFDNLMKYYETMYTHVTSEKELVIFTIRIPLVERIPFLLYKIYPVPILNKTIDIRHRYLLISNDNNYYTLDQDCLMIEKFHLCIREKLTKEDQCLHQMMNLTGQCPTIPVTFKQKSVFQISDDSLLLIPKNEQKIFFQCSNQETIEIVNQPSVIFPGDCKIDIDELKFSKLNSDTLNFRIKLPKIIIKNISNFNEKFPIEIEKVDHSLIQEAKKQIRALQTHELHNLTINSHTDWEKYTIGILVLACISISLIIFIIYLNRNYKKSKKLDSSVELNDFPPKATVSENPAVFSET